MSKKTVIIRRVGLLIKCAKLINLDQLQLDNGYYVSKPKWRYISTWFKVLNDRRGYLVELKLVRTTVITLLFELLFKLIYVTTI